MGACDFESSVRIKTEADGHSTTAAEAYHTAVAEAQYDYGHAGYTGTIAEKNGFLLIPNPKCTTDELPEVMENNPDDDKWGPACCVKVHDEENDQWYWHFYGFASS